MAANAEDQARLLVSIEATQKRFERQLASIAKAAGDSANGIESRFKKANDNLASSFDAGAKKSVASLGAQRAAVSNLSFQLNDIAMGLASGTSPFTIMVQQGSQVAQVFQGTGGGLVGAVKTLGGALATMVNPVSLASFALIGLTGVAVQYISTLSSGVPDVDKYLKEHAQLIRSFDEAWGIAEDGAKSYSEAAKQVELQKLRDEFGSTTEAAKALAGSLSDEILSGRTAKILDGSTKSASDFSRALALLEQDIPDFRQFSVEMAKIEGMRSLPDPVRQLATELRLSANASIPLQEHLEKVSERLTTLRITGDEAKAAFAALTAQAVGLGAGGGDAVSALAGKITSQLIPATASAIEKLTEYLGRYRQIQEEVNKNPLGQLAPVFSGGGQFLNSDGNPLIAPKGADPRWAVAGESAASQMVKGFENFISKAKWDVNAFRVGFGSDTVTRASGAIEKVTKDTVVTLEDAQRDLSRRLVEFQDGIRSAIGVETWKSLNDAQQAALTSIAYNYGSLPKRIVSAIEGGGGAEAVARAISGLGGDNGGINRSRRQQEAQSYLSGSGISMGSAGLTGKSPSDLFQGDVQQVKARIDALNAELAVRAQINPLVNDYGYALEKARIEQQLLSEAQRAGLEVTPQLREQISGLAENYARASTATEQLKDAQKRASDAARELSGFGKELVGGFISDLRSGVSAAEALKNALNRVLDKVIEIGLNSLFSGDMGGGKGGLLGGFLIPGILHKGGTAGSDGYGHGRAFSPSTFAGAKRYHTGGIAGLQPGEIPAILQRGEVVLPRGTKMGSGGNETITINLSADPSVIAQVADQRIHTASGTIVQVAVGQSNKQVVPTMARFQREKAGGDYRNG